MNKWTNNWMNNERSLCIVTNCATEQSLKIKGFIGLKKLKSKSRCCCSKACVFKCVSDWSNPHFHCNAAQLFVVNQVCGFAGIPLWNFVNFSACICACRKIVLSSYSNKTLKDSTNLWCLKIRDHNIHLLQMDWQETLGFRFSSLPSLRFQDRNAYI